MYLIISVISKLIVGVTLEDLQMDMSIGYDFIDVDKLLELLWDMMLGDEYARDVLLGDVLTGDVRLGYNVAGDVTGDVRHGELSLGYVRLGDVPWV